MTTNTENDDKANLIKLREMTGAGMMDCVKALKEAKGDLEEAQVVIRKRGLDIAKKKSSREAKQGTISSYIHGAGKLGVLVEINCETDFVAKNDIFQEFVRDIAMQVAAAHPFYVSQDDMAAEDLEKEKAALVSDDIANKPKEIQDKIVQGKLSKRLEDICLLNQKFVKDDSKTIQEYLTETIAKIGENIVIRRFVRFELGGSK